MLEALLPLAPVLLLILAAEFVNGWTDAPNAITTVVSTRVLRPYQAVVMATILNILGTFWGLEVAATIGKGIVKPEAINLATVGAAMVGIVFWSTLAGVLWAAHQREPCADCGPCRSGVGHGRPRLCSCGRGGARYSLGWSSQLFWAL